MDKNILKVPKKLHAITLWVHPEGRVNGSVFLREHSPDHAGSETPQEMLNQGHSFFVFKRDHPDELVFYNFRSVIRLEYADEPGRKDQASEITQIHSQIQMMDGSMIQGYIHEPLAPDRARLLDYLNQSRDGFIKVHLDNDLVYLINKSYIISVHVDDNNFAGENED